MLRRIDSMVRVRPGAILIAEAVAVALLVADSVLTAIRGNDTSLRGMAFTDAQDFDPSFRGVAVQTFRVLRTCVQGDRALLVYSWSPQPRHVQWGYEQYEHGDGGWKTVGGDTNLTRYSVGPLPHHTLVPYLLLDYGVTVIGRVVDPAAHRVEVSASFGQRTREWTLDKPSNGVVCIMAPRTGSTTYFRVFDTAGKMIDSAQVGDFGVKPLG